MSFRCWEIVQERSCIFKLVTGASWVAGVLIASHHLLVQFGQVLNMPQIHLRPW